MTLIGSHGQRCISFLGELILQQTLVIACTCTNMLCNTMFYLYIRPLLHSVKVDYVNYRSGIDGCTMKETYFCKQRVTTKDSTVEWCWKFWYLFRCEEEK